jgi:hypothetical protein
MAVTPDHAKLELDIPDLGVTLRTVFGVAAKAYETTPVRQWKLRYKGALVGTIQLADKNYKPARITASLVKQPNRKQHARPANRTEESQNCTETSATDGACVAVSEGQRTEDSQAADSST